MKKKILLSLIAILPLLTFVSFASETIDKEAVESAQKKLEEIKIQLNLCSEQEDKVQKVLYEAFRNLNIINREDSLTKEEKIKRYNKNSETYHNELRKILTQEQYDLYNSSARGQ